MLRRFGAIVLTIVLVAAGLAVFPGAEPVAATDGGPIVNGSFETGNYTGWTLYESSNGTSPHFGTWGIAQDGQTIEFGNETYDFCDGILVQQQSDGLPITYYATDGSYLAYQLQNGGEIHRMYQDVTVSPNATILTWDMWYANHAGNFSPSDQYLAVNIRNPSDDSILETLLKTVEGSYPYSIPMTSFARDISAYAGTTIRLDIEMNVDEYFFDAAFDNFAMKSAVAGGKLFMVDGYNSTIYELDASTGAVLNTIPTPTATDGGGDGLAYGDGRMFFATIGTNTTFEINPSNGTILNQFAGPETWEGIDALGFSGDKLYALGYGDNATIHVLNPDTGANITTLEPDIPLIGGLTFAGTRDSLFVSNNGGEPFPSFGMTNQGFEAGDYLGWNVYTGSGGNASVETSWESWNGTIYYPQMGSYFALLENGAQNESTYISQSFFIDAGATIEGWAFFSTEEDPGDEPYIDECSVDIMTDDGEILVDRVFYADTYDANWPDTPWTHWSWEANSTGMYTLVAGVVNIGDSSVSSYIGLDMPEEEPNTIYEIDDETGEVLNSFPAPVGSGYGLYGLGFSSTRNTLFLGFYENNMIYEVDPETGEVINSFAGPEGTAISALAADEFVSGEAPTVDITKKANPTTLPEPGGVFTFTLNITNTSAEPVTVTNLTDDNVLSPGCLALISQVLDPGEWVSCTYNVTYNDTGTYNNTAEVTIEDDEGNPASDSDTETVTVTNVNPTVDITKKANPTTLPEPGGVFIFTLNITNTSAEPVTVTNLTDDNDLSPGCLALISQVMDPGEWVSCTYNVTHNETGTYNNTVEVTVEDNEGNSASDSDNETVTVTGTSPTLVEIDKYWSNPDVCFARDMDRDGAIDGNSPECYYLGATSNGTPLDMVCGTYVLKAVIKKGTVKSYNPGQFYAVSTITVLENLDSLLLTEDYEDIILSGLGVLSPAKGGGSVVVIKMYGDIPVQILDGKSDEVYVGPSGASIELEDVEAGDIFKVYVKFAPGMKGEPFTLTGPWTNISYANAEAGDNQQIVEASASIIVVDPAE